MKVNFGIHRGALLFFLVWVIFYTMDRRTNKNARWQRTSDNKAVTLRRTLTSRETKHNTQARFTGGMITSLISGGSHPHNLSGAFLPLHPTSHPCYPLKWKTGLQLTHGAGWTTHHREIWRVLSGYPPLAPDRWELRLHLFFFFSGVDSSDHVTSCQNTLCLRIHCKDSHRAYRSARWFTG